MRIMGLDFGSKTIGVAVSDPMGWTAQGLETITRSDPGNLIASIERLKEIIEQYEIEEIIVGLPKHMNNDEGERVDKTRYFIRRLEKETNLPVDTMDERLTTAQANRMLIEGNVRREHRKKHLDQIAASLILQTYLDQRKV